LSGLDHDPVLVFSVCPTLGMPEITGSFVFDGGGGAPTGPTGVALADADCPDESVAVTTAVTSCPTSVLFSL
jgi:hypothetical protein